jgi:ribonuclease VapC
LIVVDSSAIVTILFREPMAELLLSRLEADQNPIISVASYVEAGQVLAQRHPVSPERGLMLFHDLLGRAGISLTPIDEPQAREALKARVRYGRGFGHTARLNYSDCFAYALAKTRNLPLLFIGNDFTHTDVVSALA